MSWTSARPFKRTIVVLLLIIVSFSAGFVANDFIRSFYNGNDIKTLSGLNGGEIEKKADFSIFWDAWKIIEDEYALKPLNYKKMVYGAIRGMVDSLGDPYTVFLSPEENRVFEEDMEGSFDGIGAEIGFRGKFLTVIAPLKDSPAERAGILAGDKILKVDDKETVGMNIDEAVSLIRGKKGTKVKLTISREGTDELKEIEIVRDTIKIRTVEWEMKKNRIAYIAIRQFKLDTANELDRQIDEILAKGPRGIVLDLRNNPGGYLEVAVEVASRFIESGKTVVVEDYGNNKKEIHKAVGNRRFVNIPVVVLINEGSASASEIVAGALRDNIGAKLVGKKTFGKGLVQKLEKLKGGAALKVTVARWLTPNGVNINKDGIKPDVEVDLTEDDYKNGRDPQLEKALELLSSRN